MTKIVSFESDYINGAHPKVLDALIRTNGEILTGYGEDEICARAKEKIKAACGVDGLDVYFLTGGTQTNVTVISTMLKPYEGVVCAKTGHIHSHEAGAIEFAGFKALELPTHVGKIDAGELAEYVRTFYADDNHEHMVFPGMVYLSHPTEYGTLYTKAELTAIKAVCEQYGMSLFLDGARLGYGLMSRQTDVTLNDIATICDVFYIGGTKVGALCGEAVVFAKGKMPAHFVNLVKKHGALLAKGRLIGVQFDALFTDGLYFEIGRHAIDLAERMKAMFAEKGYRFFLDSPTNQQFIILENHKMEELKQSLRFGFWEKYDKDRTVVRFATSWSTTEEDLDVLEKAL